MKELRLDNLTEHQVDILDMMWSLDTEEEFLEWYSLLAKEDQIQCDTLMKLLVLEMYDDEITKDLKVANDVLSKFKLNGS